MLNFILVLIIIALAVALTAISVEKRALNHNTKHIKSSCKQSGNVNHFKITFTFGLSMDIPKFMHKESEQTEQISEKPEYGRPPVFVDDGGPFDNDFDNEHYGFTQKDDIDEDDK